ncbi:SCA7, zinc-binding domain-containing protein [Kalaharituber pfeilii]|nr:SCA7, zinc-binding domain-containing protein [Kalaharituber pfeilii]
MPTNGTSSSPVAPKTSRPPKPPKPSKAKSSLTHTSALQSAGTDPPPSSAASSTTTTAAAKGRNKRTADVMSLFNDRELSGNTIKLKPPPARKRPRQANQGNWKERAEELEKQDDGYVKALQQAQANGNSAVGGKSPGPIVTQLDEKDLATLANGRPANDDPDHVICKVCKKPVIKSAAVQHVKACKQELKERKKNNKAMNKAAKEAAAAAALAASQGETKPSVEVKEEVADAMNGAPTGGKSVPGVDADGADSKGGSGVKKKGAKKMAAKKATGEPKKTKKQKALEEKLSKEPKPKKKKEKPAKPEPKPKAPVDVEKQCGVPLPSGLLCARSLTCKSHSMGAKRAVLGRSQPYDVLLAAYQRKNQAKQQKAAINASGPHPEEADGPLGPVDSDEETELVMSAVGRPLVPVRKKYQYLRMRDMLASALRPPGSLPPTGLFGSASGGSVDLGNPNSALGDVRGIMEGVQPGTVQADGDVVMGGMGVGIGMGGQPMIRGGGGSSRGGLFSGMGSGQRNQSVAA